MMRNKLLNAAVQFSILFLLAVNYAAGAEVSHDYSCKYTTSTIEIDGIMDAAWNESQPITMSVPVTHVPSTEPAEGRLLWDDNYLYVFIKAVDSDLKGLVTEDDEVVFREDCLEIFLKPIAEEPAYYNFEINAAGGVFDALNKYKSGKSPDWDCTGFEKFILHYGTLNTAGDTDQGWTLETKIPYSCLTTYERTPRPGETWRFHLSRYNYAERFGEEEKELSSTATLSKVNFHTSEEWNSMLFVGP